MARKKFNSYGPPIYNLCFVADPRLFAINRRVCFAVQAAACVYDNLLDGSNDSSRLNQEFGESHAMYAAYEPNTVVTVRRGDRTADLVVDDRPAGILDAAAANVTAAVGGRVLVLSRGTASQLDLPVAGRNRTVVACQARVQLLKNHPMLKTTLYVTPAVGLLVGLYALVQYNVFAPF